MMGTAVGQIHLILDELVAAEDDRRAYLPHEETVVLIQMLGHIFFHGQVKGKRALSLVGQGDVGHSIS